MTASASRILALVSSAMKLVLTCSNDSCDSLYDSLVTAYLTGERGVEGRGERVFRIKSCLPLSCNEKEYEFGNIGKTEEKHL